MRHVMSLAIVLGLAGCATVASPPVAPPGDSAGPAATGPDGARRWRRLAWRSEDGSLPADGMRNALAQRRDGLAQGAAAGGPFVAGIDPADWVERGPVNVGGRSRALLIDPHDADIVIAGSVSGGLWRSENGGASWTLIDDWMASLAIGCLTRDPFDADVLYAGTGEGFFNGDAIGGGGILMSTDRGMTWTLIPSTAEFDNVCRIAISPADSKTLLAGTRYGGIRRSTDGGASWTTVRWAQGAYDVDFHPTDANLAVAHVIDYDFGKEAWYHSALYSTDGGATWQETLGDLARIDGFGRRIELAYAPSAPQIVYASVADDGGVIYRSTDGGASYSRVTVAGASGANWYANPLWVDPTDPNLLLTGGFDVYRSDDGGVTLERVSAGYLLTEQAHPDIHNFVADPGYDGDRNRRVWCLNDGGMHVAEDVRTVSTDEGWSSRVADYRTTQFYGAAGATVPLDPAHTVFLDSSGLRVSYYELDDPQALPYFDGLTPYATEVVSNVDYPASDGAFAGSGRVDDVGAVFTGWIDIPSDGLYWFCLESDDGSRLVVDGTIVVNNDGPHIMTDVCGMAGLTAGKHEVRIEYFEWTGAAGLIFRIEGPGIERQVVPASMLTYGGAGTPMEDTGATADLLIGGTQDNGTLRVTSGSDLGHLTFGGDGGFNAIDPTNPSYTYGEYIWLRIHRSTDGGRTGGFIHSGIDDTDSDGANFIAPFVLDPNDPNRMLAGGRSLWRSTDVRNPAPTWASISAEAEKISAIAVAPGDSDVIWIGRNDGRIERSLDGTSATPAWFDVDDNGPGDPLPNRYVTRIVIDPDDHDVVYVALGGFAGDNLWRTGDGGATWTDITGDGLADAPIRGLARHPDHADWLYAGTEVGVFASDDGGATWSTSAIGPAAVSVDELVFVHGTKTLLAATHGRGLWTIDLSSAPGDVTGDGVANVDDLIAVLSAWGNCPQPCPPSCAADLDGDCSVGVDDLLEVLVAWE